MHNEERAPESGGRVAAMRERLVRVVLSVAGVATLLLAVAVFVGPSGQASGGAGPAKLLPTAAGAAKRQASDVHQIAIPLHKRKRFEAASESGQNMPYAWYVDNGDVYSGGERPAAAPGAPGPDVGRAPASATDTLPPAADYGRAGW